MSIKKKYTLTVFEKVHETADSCTIKFKQPALKKINYQAGQFITLVLSIDGRIYQRPYSISSVFGIDTTINITVKAIDNGLVSNYIKNTLDAGQTIEVIEPLGSFILPELYHHTLVLWAAGSGIAPIFALLKEALIKKNLKVLLNYSSRTKEHTILLAQIIEIQQKFKETFTFQLYLSEAPSSTNVDLGSKQRLNQFEIKNILSQINEGQTLHYICGPNSYNDLVRSELVHSGINLENIKTEDFSFILNQEDLQDIYDTIVLLQQGNNQYKIPVKKGQNILSAVLDYGLTVDYSCQTGTCELCRGQILSGTVKTILHQQKELKTKGEHCLLCCSLPLTNDILLSVN